MDEGLNYNTSRGSISISEYGRNIQTMIRHLSDIKDREERTAAAKFILSVMAQMNPQVKESNDYEHKLWDHMFIISDYKLDVDCPFEKPSPENKQIRPEHIGYKKSNIRYGHYGEYLIEMIQKIASLEDNEKREVLVVMLANQMKRSYLNWNRDNVNDALIFDELKSLSKGVLVVPADTKLLSVNELLGKNPNQQQNQQNQKKKQKKQSFFSQNPNRPNKKN